MKEASFSFPSFPLPRSAVHCEVSTRSLCSARPSLIRVLCVEVKKLSNFVRIERSDNSTTKNAPIPNFPGVEQLTQSKCCRLEEGISLCRVTCPISTDRFMFIGGPAITSPFLALADESNMWLCLYVQMFVLQRPTSLQTRRIPSQSTLRHIVHTV